MEQEEKTMKLIARHYHYQRGVGNTTLQREGVKHYDRKFAALGFSMFHLGAILLYGNENGIKNCEKITLGTLEKLDGCELPLVIEHSLISHLMEYSCVTINNLRNENIYLKRKIERAKDCLK